jgi:hypothetical protein
MTQGKWLRRVPARHLALRGRQLDNKPASCPAVAGLDPDVSSVLTDHMIDNGETESAPGNPHVAITAQPHKRLEDRRPVSSSLMQCGRRFPQGVPASLH